MDITITQTGGIIALVLMAVKIADMIAKATPTNTDDMILRWIRRIARAIALDVPDNTGSGRSGSGTIKSVVILGIFLGAGLLASACAQIEASDSMEARVTAGCSAYAGALETLAVLAEDGRLEPKHIDLVNQVRPGLNAICVAPTPPATTPELIARLEDGVFALLTIRQEYE